MADPYALHADGTAVDPAAFREAALADASLAEDLKKDERASRVLASGDDAALQELLKEVHQVCLEEGDGDWRSEGGHGERERERERSNCRPLPFFFVCLLLVCSLAPSTNKKIHLRRSPAAPRKSPGRCPSAQSTRSELQPRCPGWFGERETKRKDVFSLDENENRHTKGKRYFRKQIHRDTAQLYAQLAEAGLQYGPAFRLLRNVHVPEEAMKAGK